MESLGIYKSSRKQACQANMWDPLETHAGGPGGQAECEFREWVSGSIVQILLSSHQMDQSPTDYVRLPWLL
jgi:hypothetical protein